MESFYRHFGAPALIIFLPDPLFKYLMLLSVAFCLMEHVSVYLIWRIPSWLVFWNGPRVHFFNTSITTDSVTPYF